MKKEPQSGDAYSNKQFGNDLGRAFKKTAKKRKVSRVEQKMCKMCKTSHPSGKHVMGKSVKKKR